MGGSVSADTLMPTNADGVSIKGKLKIPDELQVGYIIVDHDGTFGNNVDIGNALKVTGATLLSNTLEVSNSTILKNTLEVELLTTLKDNLNVLKDVEFLQKLHVVGPATFDDQFDVFGNTTLNNTLHVLGAVTFDNTFNLLGNLTIGSSKFTIDSATGNTATEGTMDVKGDFKVNTNKFVITAATGNTDVLGDFKVNTDKFVITALTGNTDVKGDFKVNTDKFVVLAATGNTTVGGTFDINGDFKVNTNKFVVTALTGNTTIAGTLGVTSDFKVNTNKFVITAATGNTDILGDFKVNTNKFVVTAATGNTDILGDFKVNTNKFVVTAATGNTAVNGTALTTTSTSFDVINTNATTVNFAGAATTLKIGNAGGTTTIYGTVSINSGTLSLSSLTISGAIPSPITYPSTELTYAITKGYAITYYQPLDSDLTAISTSTLTGDGYLYRTGTTWSMATINLASVSSNIIPSANITYTLGNSTYKWKTLYVETVGASGNVVIQSDTGEGFVIQPAAGGSNKTYISSDASNNLVLKAVGQVYCQDISGGVNTFNSNKFVSTVGNLSTVGYWLGSTCGFICNSSAQAAIVGASLSVLTTAGGSTFGYINCADPTDARHAVTLNYLQSNYTLSTTATANTIVKRTAATGIACGPISCTTLNCTSITGTTVSFTGWGIGSGGNLNPVAPNTYSLGSSTYPAANIWGNTIYSQNFYSKNSGGLYMCSDAGYATLKASVVPSGDNLFIKAVGSVYFQNYGGSYVNCYGIFNNQGSDKTLKENIISLKYGLTEIIKLNPVSFNYINDTSNAKIHYGLIAQDVQPYIPDIVTTDPNFKKLHIRYTDLIPVLIKGMQEQQTQIEELRAQITQLQQTG